jgi:CIC family chloride channel protein
MSGALRLRVWVQETIRPGEQQTTLVTAGVIGLCGALAADGFRLASEFVHGLLTGQGGSYVESFAHLAWWQRLLVPTVGGLCAGAILLLRRRLPADRRGGDYMEAITLGDGRVSFRASLVQSGSALFSIASGASIGREGPLVQLSAMLASLAGRWQKIPAVRLRLYVACGAAAGIAAVYNAPIGGALFVSEVILQSIAMETFGPLVLASVVATLTGRHLAGSSPLYQITVPELHAPLGLDVLPYMALGVIAGAAAPGFLWALRSTRRGFDRLNIALPLRLALGGGVVGALAIVHPEVCGNGYSVINAILHGHWLAGALVFILLFKLAATAVSFGSGAVGGIFTPTLFVGACLGFVFASAVHAVMPGMAAAPAAFTLVGMGALLAATTQAPLMAMILGFELSLDYDVILPMMAACVLSYYVARAFSIRAVYADSTRGAANISYEHRLAAGRARQLMKPDPPAVGTVARFAEIARTFVAHRINFLYVVGDGRRFVGAISLHDVKEFLNAAELSEHVIADDLVRRDFPALHPDTSLAEAMRAFSHHPGDRLPVVSDDERRELLGSISKNDVILAVAERGIADDEPARGAAIV